MMYDSHVHSINSADGHSTVFEIAERLLKSEIKYCAITDHCELNEDSSFNEFVNSIKRTELDIAKARKVSKSEIGFGIELGSAQTKKILAENLINAFNFDVVLGSIHYLPNLGSIYRLEEYRNLSEVDEIFNIYLKEIEKLVYWNKFDVLTHLWYPIRYIDAEKIFLQLRSKIKKILIVLAQNKKALELNTKKANKNLAYIIKYCINLFAESGGKLVTLGSDAHQADLIGYEFKGAIDILRDCGFKYYVYYKNRTSIMVQI